MASNLLGQVIGFADGYKQRVDQNEALKGENDKMKREIESLKAEKEMMKLKVQEMESKLQKYMGRERKDASTDAEVNPITPGVFSSDFDANGIWCCSGQ